MDIADPELKGLISHFNKMKDFRVDQTKRHELLDILVIAVCAAITGVTTWTGVEEFGKARIDWFKTFLNLKHGIPSHDTFRRIFMLLDKDEFNQIFSNWMQEVVKGSDIEQICIDGKALRRSFERGKKSSSLHMINAWSTGDSLCLGQLECVNKKDEINTIPKLLDVIEPKNCIVSVDALGCQKKIAKKIISKGGDYLLQVKGNQPSLEQKTNELFDSLSSTPKSTHSLTSKVTLHEG